MRLNGRKLRLFQEAKNVGKKAEVEMSRSRGRLWENRASKSSAKFNLGKEAEVILAFWFGPPTAVKFGPPGRHWLGFMDGAREA